MTLTEFFAEVCRRMGWEPTPWRLAVFQFWARQEGMPFARTWNPLATTRIGPGITLADEDIGYGPGSWNTVPVRMYATPSDGVEATVQTLMLGYYTWVRQCFLDQVGYPEAIGPRDFTSWAGSDAYGRRIVEFMNSTTESRTMPAEPPPPPFVLTADMINAALQDRFMLTRLAWDPDNLKVRAAIDVLKREAIL